MKLSRVLRVRTAADLLGEVAYRIDLDHVAVFGAEDARRALLARLFDGHFLAGYGKVALYLFVDQIFHGFFLLVR